MARRTRRYPLLIYRETINRLWPEIIVLGFFLLLLAWPIYRTPLGRIQSWRWEGMLYLGGGTVLFAILLMALRSMAYIQVMPTHLRLVTPFLRLNVSLKRLRRSTAVEMRSLFSPEKMRGWKRAVIAPLGGRTAIVLELNGWPAPPELLRLFLSQFFFKDKTPHFVILVNDWMRFSTELESVRSGNKSGQPNPEYRMNQSILARLPHKDK